MVLVKVIDDGMDYEELGTIVLKNNENISELQDAIDSVIMELDNSGEEWYVSDIIDALKEKGYELEFFDDRFIGQVIL